MNQVKNEELKERLFNWKFESALKYLDGETEEVFNIVKALADMFGNVGWFEGSLAIIVAQALESIGVK